MKPLLLLDIDGVLSPIGNSVPAGFERMSNEFGTATVSPQHGVWLRQLMADFTIVWASSWGLSANQSVGPFLGLPDFPAIDVSTRRNEGTPKLDAVAAYVGENAFAWLDDELYDGAFAWAEARTTPALLIRTSAYKGLQESDVDALARFGRAHRA